MNHSRVHASFEKRQIYIDRFMAVLREDVFSLYRRKCRIVTQKQWK